MLKEYIQNAGSSINSTWYDIMPGVTVYRFETNESSTSQISPDIYSESTLFEIFFNLNGSILIGRKRGTPVSIGKHEIFLLADASGFSSVRITLPLSGILITVDHDKARKGLQSLYGMISQFRLNKDRMRTLISERQGCFLLHSTEWSRGIFTTLKELPDNNQGDFCVLKSLELLYLLSIDSPVLREGIDPLTGDSYLTGIVSEMKKYMETHLDEKLTIDTLCRRYHISATAFKTCFRRLYGQPVHSWLLEQRMLRAANLLCLSPMSILQVSQAVGYEGISQFNVIFKRRYGITPRQYRKLSNTGEL